jgi:hypothetical protein
MMKLVMPLIAATVFASAAFAASSNQVCTLTGKKVKTCCCEKQSNGKLLCKLTSKTVDKCCCTAK